MYRTIAILLMAETLLLPQVKQSSPMTPLKEVKEIQILPIVVSDPDKVKSPDATALVERSLRRAVLANEIQVVESAPLKVRVSLDEFSGGSFAKRFVVGFGSGRSTVDCRIQLLDQKDREISSARVRVRGSLAWGSYQGNTTQTKEAANKFDEALINQFEKWK